MTATGPQSNMAEWAIADLMEVGLRDDWLYLRELTRSDPIAASYVGSSMMQDVEAWNRGARAEHIRYLLDAPHALLIASTNYWTVETLRIFINESGVVGDVSHQTQSPDIFAMVRGATRERTQQFVNDTELIGLRGVMLDHLSTTRPTLDGLLTPVAQLYIPEQVTPLCVVTEQRLAQHFASHPNELRDRMLSPRHFEELIAQIWSGFGYEVELTKRTRDGGFDVVALRSAEANVRFLIECKAPFKADKITVAPVRELYGVLQDAKSTKGILATTVSFTSAAKAFLDAHPWELEGRDQDGVIDWLSRYKLTVGAT